MQNLKSKSRYIVFAILLLSALFEFHLPYVIFSVFLFVTLPIGLVAFGLIEYSLRQNVLFGLKQCEKILEDKHSSMYKFSNVLIYISITVMLYWQGFVLTGCLYVIWHCFMYYALLRMIKAKSFRAYTTGLVFNVSDIEGENTKVYILVNKTFKTAFVRDLVIGLCDTRTLRASNYGVCLTRSDAEDLLDLLKTKGWLK